MASCYATHASTVYTYTEDMLMYRTLCFLQVLWARPLLYCSIREGYTYVHNYTYLLYVFGELYKFVAKAVYLMYTFPCCTYIIQECTSILCLLLNQCCISRLHAPAPASLSAWCCSPMSRHTPSWPTLAWRSPSPPPAGDWRSLAHGLRARFTDNIHQCIYTVQCKYILYIYTI